MGITWGLGMVCLGWIAAAGWGVKIVEALSSLYLGFAATFVGGLIGGLWGFADAFLAGLVLAFPYNGFAGWKHAENVSILGQTEQPAH
jgi:hypothetical protein